jgi:nitric oxide dioxygenase
MLPPAQHALVKKTLPMMQLKSYEVAVEMYRAIFKVHPDLRNLFSLEFLAPKSDRSSSAPPGACPFAGHDTLMEPLSMQARILAKTIVDFASKVDNLSAFQGSIDRICSKHVSRDIRPEHYAVVVAAFGAAMKAVFQDDLSADEHAAWTAAVAVLAGIFIEREKCIRDQAQAREGVRPSRIGTTWHGRILCG